MSSPLTQNMADLPHILVVDDDERIRDLAVRYLDEQGFVVAAAGNADEAEAVLKRFSFDAVVLDVMMPGRSGLDLARDLRRGGDMPILLLTALGEIDDRIKGFESGADDYLPKPFEPRELVLRLQAILRRRPKSSATAADLNASFRIGRWVYDPAVKELRDKAEAVRLTDVEANLLNALAGRAGTAVTRDQLAALCGLEEGAGRTIDVQVTRLRRKIEDDARRPHWLQTVRGKGYLLRVDRV